MATLRSDSEIRQDVLDALSTDMRIDGTRVSVDVVNSVVILRGIVATYFEKRVAEDVVRRIKGVRDVANELRVMPLQPRPDDQIADDVRTALCHDVWVDEGKITVQVANGIVQLFGTVDNFPAKSHAEGDAWSVAGVVDVRNNISVEPPRNWTDAEISREVRREIDENLRVAPDAVSVAVKEGVVLLRGRVHSQEQKWFADEIAWRTAGVRDVINELAIEPPSTRAGGVA